jgi:hypothetical protein
MPLAYIFNININNNNNNNNNTKVNSSEILFKCYQIFFRFWDINFSV